MTHQTLYRRFRPQTFDAIVGQRSVVATLQNQIRSGQLAHAYLFTGSHGTGKTSTAKIMALAVNCEQPDDANPCNQCATCRSILSDANMDVIEMDAASNNGVDDIRELKEIVKFTPSNARYKVMIIDEVHMLSKGAFNALLKTLEEPPSYMIFILATSEPHKLPATITSRCQRFEFKRFDDQLILNNLADICDQLGVRAEPEALELIVHLAGGALRDAQSLLDQCLAFSDGPLTYSRAAEALGRSGGDGIYELANSLISGDTVALIDVLQRFYTRGVATAVLLDDLIDLMRAALIGRLTSTANQTPRPSAHRVWLADNQQRLAPTVWQRYLSELLKLAQSTRYASQPWLSLEVGLLALGSAPINDDQALITRIARLESDIAALKSNQLAPQQERDEPLNIVEELASEHIVEDVKQTIAPAIEPPADELAPAAIPQTAPVALTIEAVIAQWPALLNAIKPILPTTYALMKKAKPLDFQGDQLTLQMDDEFKILKQTLGQSDHIDNVKQAFLQIFERAVDIVICEADDERQQQETIRAYFESIVDADKIIIQ